MRSSTTQRSYVAGYAFVLLALLMLFSSVSMCAAASVAHPVVAIIIDDLGNTLEEGRRAVDLPGPIACAVLPHTQYSVTLADQAYAHAKEVLLHLPMQAIDDAPLGPGGITLEMTQEEIQNRVRTDVAAIPHLVGVNNHEGSLISMHPGDLTWIMQTLHSIGNLFFVDSYTTVDSIAYQIARENAVPAARRDVFLDDVNTPQAVQFQFNRLLEIARKKGFALAIGHPRPATLAVLAAQLPKLASQGIELVPVAEIVKLQQAHPIPWPESLYPLPQISKSTHY
ncbi:MAG TPA: divergent polysaccharide deacetylase family protein [Gammaproteobacteria bacterium]|nr:divergent polysaccharide deacetylase family protein [Gammaproteobacteria bacterium]